MQLLRWRLFTLGGRGRKRADAHGHSFKYAITTEQQELLRRPTTADDGAGCFERPALLHPTQTLRMFMASGMNERVSRWLMEYCNNNPTCQPSSWTPATWPAPTTGVAEQALL